MKRKELTIIGAVAFFTAVVSFLISGSIFGSPSKNPISVPVVNKISSSFPDVANDDNYKPFFNGQANDPTQLIKIGGTNNNNTVPFQEDTQH